MAHGARRPAALPGEQDAKNMKDLLKVEPEVGSAAAFRSCVLTGTHGPTRVFWAVAVYLIKCPSFLH